MDQELISVIVPIYNVEQYLDRCISSIAGQTYRNLEILLIDDESTDNSPKICDEWEKKDERIRAIHKANAGAGMARNTGIEHANGKYIFFFDSDDYTAPNAIETAYKAAVEHQADVVVYGAARVDEAEAVLWSKIPEPRVYQGNEVLKDFLPAMMGEDPRTGYDAQIPLSPWSCLFSAELIHRTNWRYVSEREIVSEDVYSQIELYQYVQKVVVLEDCLYFYCRNGASLTQSYRADRYERNRDFYLKCVEMCRSSGYSDEVIRRCREPFLCNVISVLRQEVAYHRSSKVAVKHLRRIMDDDVLQQVAWAKKQDKTNPKKALLYWSIRHKRYWICYALLKARNKASD